MTFLRPTSLRAAVLPILVLLSSSALHAQAAQTVEPTILTNPSVAWSDTAATTVSVKGMHTGQNKGPNDSKPLRQLHAGSSQGKTGGGGTPDGALQNTATPSNGTLVPGLNFEGLGNGLPGFTVDSAPPDTNGAVGASQYVQWVNESFAVFDKATGAVLAGPISGNQLFTALGASHPCAVNNDGDPIAQYDKLNNRWVLSQFSVTNGSVQGYFQCIAVSDTADATGTFHVYAFRQPSFNDYPKFGVFNGIYYETYNMFKGNRFSGSRLCAYDANAMRAGSPATEQCFQLTSAYGGVLPADGDGLNQPPAGTDEYFLAFGTNSLLTWRFHLDLTNSANSTLTGPYTTTVPAFSEACGGATCIPQPNTSQQLDSLGDRLMYRLSYRNFGSGHESLFVNHSTNPGAAAAGTRWYELRPANGGSTGVVYVQGSTYAPADGLSRWMGSIASDKTGNLAVGYSTSSSTAVPSIRYSFRTPTDPSNRLGSEQLLFAGSGSQTHGLNRWGDYSAMTVDPVDDCTFWYTNEYLPSDGTFNWHTRIANFKIQGCK